ncbi:uncharacterized protein LOC105847735 [Hydra vulgaris]|uniref:uncharacterized protein LOC105847735 n=1 Tax=Hydra vulgaris TaxID=6087 RepID=UPI0032EA1119
MSFENFTKMSGIAVNILPEQPETWSSLDVTQWLINCNLESYVEKFKEEDIDGTVLLDIDDYTLKELIPIIKLRITFKKEWQRTHIAKFSDECNFQQRIKLQCSWKIKIEDLLFGCIV